MTAEVEARIYAVTDTCDMYDMHHNYVTIME